MSDTQPIKIGLIELEEYMGIIKPFVVKEAMKDPVIKELFEEGGDEFLNGFLFELNTVVYTLITLQKVSTLTMWRFLDAWPLGVEFSIGMLNGSSRNSSCREFIASPETFTTYLTLVKAHSVALAMKEVLNKNLCIVSEESLAKYITKRLEEIKGESHVTSSSNVPG